MPDPIENTVPPAPVVVDAAQRPAAPAAPIPPAVQAAPPVPPPPAARPAGLDADAVEKRIIAAAEAASKKAQAELLASLGVTNADEAAAVLKKHREAEEAQKSELQRLLEANQKLETTNKTNALYRERLSVMIQAEVDALKPEQKAAVSRLAGDDPLQIANALEVLRPTWASSAAPAAPIAPAAQPAAPVLPAAPASAALPAGAPAPTGQKSKWQEYDEMRAIQPALAGFFYQAHRVEIERTRPPLTN